MTDPPNRDSQHIEAIKGSSELPSLQSALPNTTSEQNFPKPSA